MFASERPTVTLDPIMVMKKKSAILDTMMESLRKPIQEGPQQSPQTGYQNPAMQGVQAGMNIGTQGFPQQAMSSGGGGQGIPQQAQAATKQKEPNKGGNGFWLELAKAIGVPAASAIVGMAAPGTLPAMAGLSTGYAGGYKASKDRQAELEKERMKLGQKTPQDLVNATRLRQEFINRPETKEYVLVNTQVKSMDSLLNKALKGDINNKVALDQALITMYNKLTDPQSVVRESEYARTPENLPIINRLNGAISKVNRGGAGLTDDDRKALVWGAKVIANERGGTYNNTMQGYAELSGEYGVDPKLVVGGLGQHVDFPIQDSNVIQEEKNGTGKLMQDANGNRAIVYPDGTFKEIQ